MAREFSKQAADGTDQWRAAVENLPEDADQAATLIRDLFIESLFWRRMPSSFLSAPGRFRSLVKPTYYVASWIAFFSWQRSQTRASSPYLVMKEDSARLDTSFECPLALLGTGSKCSSFTHSRRDQTRSVRNGSGLWFVAPV